MMFYGLMFRKGGMKIKGFVDGQKGEGQGGVGGGSCHRCSV